MIHNEELVPSDLVDVVVQLKNLLVARATGSIDLNADLRFTELRRRLIREDRIKDHLPRFIRNVRTLDEFWQYIKEQSSSYAGRRFVLQKEFEPVLALLEHGMNDSIQRSMDPLVNRFDTEHLNAAMSRIVARLPTDPAGVITAARSLLETTLKHLLHRIDADRDLPENPSLPELYKAVMAKLPLADRAHSTEEMKRILGACSTIVDRIAGLRNGVGDAHGQWPDSPVATKALARLVANAAIMLAVFVCELSEDASEVR